MLIDLFRVVMKYPIGIQSFDQVINDGYVYVDKTDIIHDLVINGKIYFLSRPRRFGKSLLVSTLKAYFQGKKELFKGLAIESLEKEWIEYPVFHIDFNGLDATRPGELEAKIEDVVSSGEELYGKNPIYTTIGDRFREVLKRASEKYGRRAVVLIDEYDKPILDVLDTEPVIGTDGCKYSLEDRNRQILKAFYSVFKAADEYLRFVLLTGVTKFSQVSVFSGFNQPADISLDRRYEALCGITEEELYSYFEKPICELASRYGYTEEEMKAKLKRQYDGYHFSDELTDIYNPFSLLNTFASQRIDDYWFRSGTPSYLVKLLNHTDEDLDELTGRYYDPSEFVDYKADVQKPLPMIYQSGYLTIKDCNLRHNTFLLDFPNDEVRKGFLTIIATNYLKPQENTSGWTVAAVDALEKGDVENFIKLLTGFLADIPYSMRRKETERERERYFHYTFYLLMRMISCYTVYTEKQQSQGRVDCIVEVPDYVYIFEFKLDGTAADALDQIKDKGYAKPYSADHRKIYSIGVSFSSDTGTIDDWRAE